MPLRVFARSFHAGLSRKSDASRRIWWVHRLGNLDRHRGRTVSIMRPVERNRRLAARLTANF